MLISIIIVVALGLAGIGFCIIKYNDKSADNNIDNCEVNSSSNNSSEIMELKPIIYLYPTETMKLNIKLGNSQNLTCSYPKYDEEGWNVIANPDGTLVDTDTQRSLYALYWEGKANYTDEMKEGFVVSGEDVQSFLEEKLAILGLNEREAEEFIVYWLPKLEANKYNYIRFATMDEINNDMPIQFSTNPDTLIRVMMRYKALDEYVEVEEQQLETPQRTGFVAVEWGGSEIN